MHMLDERELTNTYDISVPSFNGSCSIVNYKQGPHIGSS